MTKKYLWLILLSFFHLSICHSQSFFKNRSLIARVHYGYIAAHRERIEHIVEGHTSGFQIDLQKQTDGAVEWQQIHGYPQFGFSYVYVNLANDALLGRANALMGYINFPLVKKRSFQFDLHLGSGLGYLSKRYERVENHKNLAIGSHLNAAIQIMAETQYRLSNHLFMHLNYGVTHFSNGAYHVPNLGINNISLNAGLRYQFTYPVSFIKRELPAYEKAWSQQLIYAVGVKEAYPPSGHQYFAHTLSYTIAKQVSYKSVVGFGGDVFYDLSLSQFADDPKASEIVRGGLHVSYEMLISKVTMVLQMGGYVYDQFKLDGSFYHRFGWHYTLNKNLFANLSLKTHFARADYVELGMGWRFE